ncbi:MAG: hypothetical protein R2879_10430 [Saprospiraceae bacterium]
MKKNIFVKSFSETLTQTDLKGLAIDYSEIGLDSMIEDGVLSEIPVIKTIVAIGNTSIKISNYFFIKKIASFLSDLDRYSPEERNELISQIDNDPKTKIKVGEKILYLLEKAEDHLDAKLISMLFCAFLSKEIRYEEFLKGSRIIISISYEDLSEFLLREKEHLNYYGSMEEIPNEDDLPLINAGLLGFGYNLNNRSYYQEEISGMGEIYITSIGYTLRKILDLEKL